MSIILEALKKATKESPAEVLEAKKNHEAPPIEPKKPEPQTPELSLPRLTKSTLISLAIIIIGGSLLFFLLRGYNLPVAEKTEPQAQPTRLALTENQTPPAEGYAPVNIFKIKLSNPRLTLNGIISGIGKPTAIIDNKIVEEGTSINGAKVVKIYSDRVELQNETSGETFTLSVY